MDDIQKNAATLIAISSMVIAFCSLLFTAYNSFATRRHNRLSVLPRIASYIERELMSADGMTTIEWTLVNHGLGPARIVSYAVYFDGVILDTTSVSEVLKTLNKAFDGIPSTWYVGSKRSGEFLAKDSRITVLRVVVPSPPLGKALSDLDKIGMGIDRYRVKVEYKSIYGESFEFDSEL